MNLEYANNEMTRRTEEFQFQKTMTDLSMNMQDADRSLQLNSMMRSFMELMKDGIKSEDSMKKL